ncbi:hypothetical protein [Actinoplanes sp. NPDC048796]|uniref:hypothetical protein n=1 Tax=Actinoplanes sp. NPDC048796 TaxID=3155640 RepID=UPI0033CC1272
MQGAAQWSGGQAPATAEVEDLAFAVEYGGSVPIAGLVATLGERPIMEAVRGTYDEVANAAHIYLHPRAAAGSVAKTYPCDPLEVDGMINLGLLHRQVTDQVTRPDWPVGS